MIHAVPSRMRTALGALALVLGLWAPVGCCELNGTCSSGDDENTSERSGDVNLEDALASEACPAEGIDADGGEVCAACDSQTGEGVRVCGDAVLASCNNQENAFGERCQQCATPDGQVLYDDCAVNASEVGAARCETVTGDGDPVSQDGATCSVCFDDNGDRVSASCEPAHDECHQEVEDSGRVCRVCSADGEVVIYQCDAVDLDPSSCELYQNDVGVCVDCYGEDQALLSHQCQLFGDELVISCSTTVDPSGYQCEVCEDQNGVRVDSNCNAGVPSASACQLLEYSTQTCVVCVDPYGEPVLLRCESVGCEDGASCPPPPECGFERQAEGPLCRTCPADEVGTTETRCLSEPNVQCSEVPVDQVPEDPNAPGGGDQPAPPQDQVLSCLLCSDVQTGVEVYRDCAGGSAAQPPVCADVTDDNGVVCNVCYDAATGAALYSSCDEGDTCYVTGERALTTAEGSGLERADGSAANATCYQCGAEGNDQNLTANDFTASCAVPQACTAPDGLTNQDGGCPAIVSYVVAPRFCDNGWLDYHAAPATEAELVAVLAWALADHQVELAADALLEGTVESCSTSCECPRGDLLEVSVAEEAAGIARELFLGSLLSCQADDGCPAGSLCLDGVCGR